MGVKKVTLKSIKDMVRVGVAKEFTPNTAPSEGLALIAHAKTPSAYCASARLYQGYKTGKLYALIGKENCIRFH